MKILFDMLHPAHVHKFKNVIKELEKRGHKVIITVRDKDVTIDLLNKYNFSYTSISKIGGNFFDLFKEGFSRNIKLIKICLKEKPDVLVGFNGISIAQVGFVLRIPSLYITENEDAKLLSRLSLPFSRFILTEKGFKKDYGKKHIRMDSFFELSYLSPKYFKPEKEVLKINNIKENEFYSVIRFVSWKASHDINEKGFSIEQKRKLINFLKEKGKVIVNTEGEMPEEFKEYKMKSSPEKIHSLLYYADFYMGDSQVMSSESGLLGTPSIRCNSMVNTMHAKGKFDSLESLNLVYSIEDPDKAIEKAEEILKNKNSKKEWQNKRDNIIKTKVDSVDFITNLIIKIGKKQLR